MPHIVLDYAAGLEAEHDLQALCTKLHQGAAACGIFPDPDAIKVRARPCPFFLTGGGKAHFVHVDVHLLEGRSIEQKAHVSQTILQVLDTALPDVVSLSVDIHDILRASYAKRTL